MIWPGTSDPRKRKKTIRFLIITAIIGISAAAASSMVQQVLDADNPLKVCINDRNTPYKIEATLEIILDGEVLELQENVGNDENCQRSMYTLSGDGTIYAEWEEEYPFEIGHFLWMAEFPLRDMEQSQSAMYVNGEKSSEFINHPLQDGYHYKAVFKSKAFDEAEDRDFLPPDS